MLLVMRDCVLTGLDVICGELLDFKLILMGATRLGGVGPSPSQSGSSFEGVGADSAAAEERLLLVLNKGPTVRLLTLREAVRSGP